MSESYPPLSTGPQDVGQDPDRIDAVASHAREAGAAVARDAQHQAESIASHAAQETRDVVDHASTRAQDVMQEAQARVATLVDQAARSLNEAGVQQQRLSAGLRSLGAELGLMGNAAADPGYASELVRHGAQAANRLATWFDAREPRDVVREVEGFARRRPGVFLAAAAGAGLVAGRLLRGAKATELRTTPSVEGARTPEVRRTDGGAQHVA